MPRREPDQQLVVYAAERGSASEQALHKLAEWATDNIRPVSPNSAPSTGKRSRST